MLCIPVKEFLFWKRKQLSKGGDNQSFDFLLDSIGGLSKSNLNLLNIHQEGNLNLKKKFRSLRNYLGQTHTKLCPNPTPLWNDFLEGFKIKSYR